MRTKIYLVAVFLFATINVIQAQQINGQLQFNREALKTTKENGFDRIIIHDNSFFIEDLGSLELPVLLKSYLVPVAAILLALIILTRCSKDNRRFDISATACNPSLLLLIIKSCNRCLSCNNSLCEF